ncbi:hypothetical protein AUC43_03060 [Hymenobacter sedentarius]|uniref:Uncharacterized protein n=1 Tax=Hymenobacter sedentarius TaxID=1411621 RepID=A0A0U3SDF4_9BACT|nr:hypothetical protein AUC43_03060 [Hymenobacter sedentarius]
MEIYEQDDVITLRHPGLDKPEQCVSTATFRKQWKVVREINLLAGDAGNVMVLKLTKDATASRFAHASTLPSFSKLYCWSEGHNGELFY